MVSSPELQDAVEEILPSLLEQQVTVYILTDTSTTVGMESFTDKMSLASSEPLSKDLRSHVTLHSPAAYIYTSGTTGELLQALTRVIPHPHVTYMQHLASVHQVSRKQRWSLTPNCGSYLGCSAHQE